MHNIEARGLADVVARIDDFAKTLNADNWSVAPLLKELANSGASLKNWQAND